MKKRIVDFIKKGKGRRQPTVKIKIVNGHFKVQGAGAWYLFWRDPYHMVQTVSWSGFIGVILLCYLAINLFFGGIFFFCGDCIANAKPNSFQDAFFFSVHTLGGIGYGNMHPATQFADIIVTVESIVRLFGIALMTSLAFARFTRPTARVLFSRKAVITIHDGVETLMFRLANERRNQILEAHLNAYLLRDEISLEGERMRRIHDLKLVRQQTPYFMLTWTAMHPIDKISPLYGKTTEDLEKSNTTITVILRGVDETVKQIVYARYSYAPQEIIKGKRFADIISHGKDGYRRINYSLFHKVVDTEPGDSATEQKKLG